MLGVSWLYSRTQRTAFAESVGCKVGQDLVRFPVFVMLAERQHLVGQPTPRCPEEDGRVHLVRKGVLAVRPAKSCQGRNQALVSNGRARTRRGTRKGHAVPGPLVLGRSDLQGLDNRVVLVHLAPPWAEPGSVGVDPLLARLVPGGAVPGPWAGHAARIRQRSAGAGA